MILVCRIIMLFLLQTNHQCYVFTLVRYITSRAGGLKTCKMKLSLEMLWLCYRESSRRSLSWVASNPSHLSIKPSDYKNELVWGSQRIRALGKNEIEWLQNRVMVEINGDINLIEEVGIPRDQFWEVAVIRFCQNVGRGEMFHCGQSSIEFHHTAEHDGVRRNTIYNPSMH